MTMNNPIFQAMIGNRMGNIQQAIAQLKQQYNGDPNQFIQQLLNSGRIKQSDYDRAVNSANQIMKMLGR
jgi:hypothetical protein